ncbi:hypothetical protein DEM27_01565 [Metarhizobium album]|uniref:Uncharacterized protein n=2 Tax=Metarhizobium album TaxID=2182425 RepID=A0A2U2DX57_9HYPH|nr:hypothetical protein DEM27_01565 [Rhizobium album]
MNGKVHSTDEWTAPVVTRRKAIIAIAAAGAIAALPTASTAEESEDAWDKACRLADELSGVLNETRGGGWFVTVYPGNHSDRPICFRRISSHLRRQNEIDPRLKALIDAHEMAFRTFSDECIFTDQISLGRKATKTELRRYCRAAKREAAAFDAVLAFVPRNDATRIRKAQFLLDFNSHSQLNDNQVELLLISMCGGFA